MEKQCKKWAGEGGEPPSFNEEKTGLGLLLQAVWNSQKESSLVGEGAMTPVNPTNPLLRVLIH